MNNLEFRFSSHNRIYPVWCLKDYGFTYMLGLDHVFLHFIPNAILTFTYVFVFNPRISNVRRESFAIINPFTLAFKV
jgi:hypothetical protein